MHQNNSDIIYCANKKIILNGAFSKVHCRFFSYGWMAIYGTDWLTLSGRSSKRSSGCAWSTSRPLSQPQKKPSRTPHFWQNCDSSGTVPAHQHHQHDSVFLRDQAVKLLSGWTHPRLAYSWEFFKLASAAAEHVFVMLAGRSRPGFIT